MMTNPTIPTLESISDLTAIIEWQAPVFDTTDVSLLPNDVYMYGNGLYFCIVWDGKLAAKNLQAGSCYRIFAGMCYAENDKLPFDGSYYAELESEE